MRRCQEAHSDLKRSVMPLPDQCCDGVAVAVRESSWKVCHQSRSTILVAAMPVLLPPRLRDALLTPYSTKKKQKPKFRNRQMR